MKKWKLGNITIAASGTGKVFDEVCAELSEVLQASDSAVDIEYAFEAIENEAPLATTGSVSITSEGIIIKESGITAQLAKGELFKKILIHVEQPKHKSPFLKGMNRFRDWNFLTETESVAKNFMYCMFDWTSQLLQLQHEQSYIHASSMERDGKGLAIMGWGGVGKTTSALKLVQEEGWRFLSDDLGIIDEEGTLFPAPKRLQIYGYNTQNQPLIADALLKGRGIMDKMNWNWRMRRYGGNRVRRRISAPEMFGSDRIGSPIKLTNLLFLQKSGRAQSEIEDLSPQMAARRMASIVLAEIEPYGSYSREAVAAGSSTLPSAADIELRTVEVLEKAFAKAECYQLNVYDSSNPDRLAGKIVELVN